MNEKIIDIICAIKKEDWSFDLYQSVLPTYKTVFKGLEIELKPPHSDCDAVLYIGGVGFNNDKKTDKLYADIRAHHATVMNQRLNFQMEGIYKILTNG